MDKILELLELDKLDESKQTEIKEKIESIIEVKVNEKVKEKEDALKESLIEEYDAKFDSYKEEITEKFSNFVDDILEEELVIPENILEYARKGELYFDLIEQFKTRFAIDEGYIDNEVKELLREAKEEIQSLKSEIDEKINENLDIELKLSKSEATAYILEKIKGLPMKEAESALSLLEGEKDTDAIDRKLHAFMDVLLEEKDEDDEEDEEDDKDKKKKKKKDDDDEDDEMNESVKGFMSLWTNTLKEAK